MEGILSQEEINALLSGGDLLDSEDNPKFEIYCETRINYLFRNQSYEAIIPKGFTTDFASVPMNFRSVISNVSKFNVA